MRYRSTDPTEVTVQSRDRKSWFVRRNGRLIASYGYAWQPANNGSAFSRNYDTATVSVHGSVIDATGTETKVLDTNIGEARYKADADKLARKFFRENDTKRTLLAAVQWIDTGKH